MKHCNAWSSLERFADSLSRTFGLQPLLNQEEDSIDREKFPFDTVATPTLRRKGAPITPLDMPSTWWF